MSEPQVKFSVVRHLCGAPLGEVSRHETRQAAEAASAALRAEEVARWGPESGVSYWAQATCLYCGRPAGLHRGPVCGDTE